MPPEREKPPREDSQTLTLPAGIQQIFSPEEESEAATAETSPQMAPASVSKDDLLQKAVASITDLVASTPLMAPGSPRQIMDETPPTLPLSTPATSLSPLVASPNEAVEEEDLSIPPATAATSSALSPDVSALRATSPEILLSEAPPTSTISLLEPSSRPSVWSTRSGVSLSLSSATQEPYLQVGTVRPISAQPEVSNVSPRLLLHDFRPGEMLSQYVPPQETTSNSFHNLLSQVFLDNLPCAKKDLLKAMAMSLEARNIPVLHGIELPEDPGLLPDDPLHMASYLYVGALFDEFEDYLQSALHDKSSLQQLLHQEKDRHQQCQDQLQALREMNALLAKSASPAEKEQIIRLQQECRKSSQSLLAVTQDFHEIKALSERLQQQLDTAQAQRISASSEAQDTHEKLQILSAELSRLKIKMISMIDPDQASSDSVQLQTKVASLSLDLEQQKQHQAQVNLAMTAAEARCTSLSQDKLALQEACAQVSAKLEEAEQTVKSLQTTRTELTVQVKDLSRERDAAAPLLSDAKIRTRSHKAEMATIQDEKKSLQQTVATIQDEKKSLQQTVATIQDVKKSLQQTVATIQDEKKSLQQTVASRDENITSLKGKLETLSKDNKKASTETAQELERAKDMVDKLSLEKSKLIRQAKADGVNFFSLRENQEKTEKLNEEALTASEAQIGNLKEAALAQAAIKASLEEELTAATNQVLDLTEQLNSVSVTEMDEKTKAYKQLRKRHHKLVRMLQKQVSADDSSSNTDSETDSKDLAPSDSRPSPSLPVSQKASAFPHNSPPPESPKSLLAGSKSYSAATRHGTGASQTSQDDYIELTVKDEDRFPPESLRKKRERSPRRVSTSPRSRKKSRSGSSDRSIRYLPSPARQQQRETQLHYDLDVMDASTHAKAYDLLQLHLRDSIETISQDKGFIRYLRSSASNREKSSRVKTLLQGYAQCTSLSDLAALNKGKPPKSDNSFQPLPDLSPGSNEWVFIQSSVKNNFVHFPSIMALIRLYCCKLYAMFHFGKKSDPETRKETIALLHTADRDSDNIKRSDWEKKLDLLLVLIVGRLVFYTLDHVEYFECNLDRSLYLSAVFLSDDFMEQMISTRTYQDPYLLPRRTMYTLYTDCYGSKAKRDFNLRIARYEPVHSRHDDADNLSRQPTSSFSWMDQ